MENEFATRLLQALAEAAAQRLGPDHAITIACRAADLTNARAMLDRLDPQIADALFAAAHKQMREDVAAVLAQWWPGRTLPH